MDEFNKLVSVVGPSGIQEVYESDLPGLEQAGYRRATEQEVKVNTLPQQALGVGEAVGRGFFGPAFTAAEKYLLGVDEKDIVSREENLGAVATGVEIGSMVLPGMALNRVASLAAKGLEATKTAQRLAAAARFTQTGLAEGLANVASKNIEGKIAKMALHYGIDNAAFSVFDDVDKMLLSSEPKDAIDTTNGMVLNAGLSFLVGAGGGASVGKISELWKARRAPKLKGALDAAKAVAEEGGEAAVKPGGMPGQMAEEALDEAAQAAGATPGATTAQEAAEAAAKAAPKPAESISDLDKELLNYVPEQPEFKKENRRSIEEALGRLEDLEYVPHAGELRAQESAEAKRVLDVAELRPDNVGKKLRNHKMRLKAHLTEKLNKVVDFFNPKATGEMVDTAKEVVEGFAKNYETEYETLKEGFKAFDKVGANPVSATQKILGVIEESVPGASEYIKAGEDGKLKLVPYDIEQKWTEETRKQVEKLIKILNKGKQTIGGLENARKNIRDAMLSKTEVGSKGRKELNDIVSKMFGYIEEEAELAAPDIKTRDTFKRYGQNERKREIFEKIIGGDIYGKDITEKQIKYQNVINSIFRNDVTIENAKNVLTPEQYKQALGEWLKSGLMKAADKQEKTFSSRKFATWLKQNGPELKIAFTGNEKMLQRIEDLTEVMKVIPDHISANPSATAPTAAEMLKQLVGIRGLMDVGNLASAIGQKTMGVIEDQLNKAELNAVFKGKETKAGLGMYRFFESKLNVSPEAFQAMQDYMAGAAQGAYLFSRATKAVFDATEKEPVKPAEEKKLVTLDKEMKSYATNPNKMLELGGEVGYYMPEQATSIGLTVGRVAGYLATKRPGIKQSSPFSKPTEPTKAQMSSYYRTLQIAENPLVVLNKIKTGSLQSSDVADLKAMYPEVYNKMLIQLTDSVLDANQESKTVPFKVKKSLSLFVGAPLETSLQPQAIQAAQATYQQQGQQAQGALPQMAPKSSRKSQLPSITQTDQQRRMLER